MTCVFPKPHENTLSRQSGNKYSSKETKIAYSLEASNCLEEIQKQNASSSERSLKIQYKLKSYCACGHGYRVAII